MTSANDEITVISRTYGLTVKRTWKAKLVKQEPPLIELVGEFDRDVEHLNLGFIERGTISYEYYWLDRWYNVFRFHKPEGELRNFYCNITLPPKFENGILDYIDLDIDILVWANRTFEILDMDEFEENSIRFKYSDDIRATVNEVICELTRMLKSNAFPFSL